MSDRVNQVIYIFDKSGKYLTSVGKRGAGPDEYSEIGDFVLIGDSILIQDKYLDKILIYNSQGIHLSNINLPDLPYVELAYFDNKLVFIISYEKSEFGYYNLATFDLATKEYHTFLPYAESTPLPWGLSHYIDIHKQSALFILPRDNNIYEIDNSNVSPQYIVSFSKKSLPPSLLKKDGGEILFEALEKDYIKGLGQITNSEDYLFLGYSEGNSPREVLFDKKTQKNQVCNWFILNDAGGLYANRYLTTDNDEFIIIQDANMFITAWNNVYSKEHFNPYCSAHLSKD
jgi:hypothetical protein